MVSRVDDILRKVKKSLRDNVVTIIAATLLLVTLAFLIWSRYSSLYSIRDIAITNPLITTENSELVAVNINGKIVLVKYSGNSSDNKDDESSDASKNQSGNKTTDGKTEGVSSGSGSAGSNTGASPSNSPNPPRSLPPSSPAESFAASVELKSTNSEVIGPVIKLGDVQSCKNKHTIVATVTITGASGSSRIEWYVNGVLQADETEELGPASKGGTKTPSIVVDHERLSLSVTVAAKIIDTSDSEVIGSGSKDFYHSC